MAETENKNPPPANTPPPAQSLDGDSLDAPGPDTKPTAATGVGEPKEAPAKSGGGRSFNIYFIFFIVVVIAAIGSIVFAVQSAQKASKSNAKKTQSLTS